MKKLKLFPKAPNKEVRIGNSIFLGAIVYLMLFGFTIPYLTTKQALIGVWFIGAIAVVGIFFKIKGIIKAYRFVKQEIAAGRPFEIEIG
jgi:hypothetical protein